MGLEGLSLADGSCAVIQQKKKEVVFAWEYLMKYQNIWWFSSLPLDCALLVHWSTSGWRCEWLGICTSQDHQDQATKMETWQMWWCGAWSSPSLSLLVQANHEATSVLQLLESKPWMIFNNHFNQMMKGWPGRLFVYTNLPPTHAEFPRVWWLLHYFPLNPWSKWQIPNVMEVLSSFESFEGCVEHGEYMSLRYRFGYATKLFDLSNMLSISWTDIISLSFWVLLAPLLDAFEAARIETSFQNINDSLQLQISIQAVHHTSPIPLKNDPKVFPI